MNINTELVKVVQHELNKRYGFSLVVDGDAGKKTTSALLQIDNIPTHWDKNRQLIGFIQHICAQEEINAGPIDGRWGTQTEYGYEQLKVQIDTGELPAPWRDDEGIDGNANQLKWPLQTQRELTKFYGAVGTNMTKVTVPYPLKIAWATEKVVTRFTCHEKVADSIQRVLTRVVDHYDDRISELGLDLWGGCLNVRKMRGGSKWSTHSWGMAIDWDPSHNRLRWESDKAQLAKSDYDVWWELWEDEGWVSLGRARNYDWMHVQAAKVRK